ncbi:hypothetical protein QAD02_013756 [Eretmocerus hayati]|uniref:Uncharacterized protein n=1 Tax=Eretmocerus hayati TaxID=131215 RepID=A0ACC2P3S0_9HYME|nr:hypothetical protein QAD02_013756 [Eretmocerus hayati]
MPAPKSWITTLEDIDFVKFMGGNPGPGDYTMISQLCQIEAQEAPGFWKQTRGKVHEYFKTFDESFQYIQGLVKSNSIKGIVLKIKNLSDSLQSFVSAEKTLEEDSAHQIQNESLTALAGSNTEEPLAIVISEELTHITPSEQIPSTVGEPIPSTSEPSLSSIMSYEVGNVEDSVVTQKFLTDIFKNTNQSLASMDAKISNLQTQVNEIRVDLKKSHPETTKIEVTGFDDLVLQYELVLPLTTAEDFSVFDTKVVGQFYRDLKHHLISTTYEYEEVKESLSKIFKRFFSKAVLERYTAKQKGKDATKNILAETEFFKCLHAIGKVISDAKDWGKGREERRSKQKNETPRTPGESSPKKRASNTDENGDSNRLVSPAEQSRSSDTGTETESILRENSLALNHSV